MGELVVNAVSVSFGGTRAVQQVSFTVPAGTIFSIIGPNGAGKSTLFNVLTGITPPDQGNARYGGVELTGMRPSRLARQGIARTFQNLELFSQGTVFDNILLGRHLHFTTSPVAEALRLSSVRRQERENRRRTDEIIEFLRLGDFRDEKVDALPYGICKIVELGRALACEPKLLLLDEPAAGLNSAETERMCEWIETINGDLGVTVVLIEHDMHLVNRVSRRVLALNAGQTLVEGTPAEVTSHPEVIRAYLGG